MIIYLADNSAGGSLVFTELFHMPVVLCSQLALYSQKLGLGTWISCLLNLQSAVWLVGIRSRVRGETHRALES